MNQTNFKIAIFLSQKENIKILNGFLRQFYVTILASKIEDVYGADMLITDGLYLKKHFTAIKSLKETSGIVFFPVLLVTNVKEAGMSSSNVWHIADELINVPVLKIELLSRVKILIKTRELSLDQRVEYVENLKIAKEKAEESDRLKTSFLHNVSHEIRTPLNAIVGFSRIISEPETSAELRHSFSEIITKSSDHLLSIVDDILKLASIEAGQEKLSISYTNINNKLELLYQEFVSQAKEKNIAFEYQLGLSDNESIISVDETKFLQILTNLLSNAFKFTQNGHISFGYQVKEKYLEFFVEDTGIGIPSKYHEQIYQRFHKVEIEGEKLYGGSGIGLAISKAYAEMLGGNIWLKSEEGKGSVFYFSLPYNKIRQKAIAEDQIIEAITLENTSRTILVSEDEDINFLYIETLLTNDKIRLLRANNGQEAVEICESNPEIELILMDIKMPVMSGFEAAKKIKKFRPDLPIIAQTAYSTASDRNKAFESGCCDFISKPFTKENLMAKIASQLNSGNL